ncbi:asparagine synthase (glutamine-hydrolysing) [Mariniflexile fucanivorans]|uniref:asparagine synthase (glutamine-hydrolyzing) n=1 Tax=Mariniflexile fucanivorans TaxID=264023 RepID=A0A4R1RGG7_9FLAO|nr:asparagine synthase (glutamine-hydrolyzing) [Mariniflexile fucanivorans]TCL65019.1 asparagine synthase (glutamine-hydrolysing) [Mariniflexile fucanivorans]
MCGINGFITSKQEPEKQLISNISLMNDLIIHRGPDDDGVFTYSDTNGSVALGMRRLSIIDLSSGKQPIYSDDKKIVIIFNGEIYNYKILRKELVHLGVTFKTHSDTEVILKLYENQGTTSFKKLDGMFAFSIFDKNLNKVFIARDFFGEKPLYYTTKNDIFIWGSELKSILKLNITVPEIDKMGLNLFFKLTYIPAPFTIYKNIHKLKPNHFITYDCTTHTHTINLIEEEKPFETKNISYESAKKSVKQLVQESVESRSVSDVPIGTFLSGGVDSSIVSLCLAQMNASKINTFSIGFEKKSFDESDKARTVAKLINSEHHEFIVSEKNLEENIYEILNNFDEPFADSSSLPTYLVANKTSQHVKVALTGDGGDEVFGGYNKYYMGAINQKYTKIVPQEIHKVLSQSLNTLLNTKDDNRGKRFRAKRLINAIDYSGNHYWDIISLGFAANSLSEYLLPEFYIENPFDYYKNVTGINSPKNLLEYRAIDKVMSLEGDMLVKVDRTSMLSSLECRAPFLNKKIWDYTNQLPQEYLIKAWDKKHILKAAFKDKFPKDFLDKSKAGFGVPVGDWLRNTLKQDLLSYSSKELINKQHLFNYESIKSLITDHLNGNDHTFKVWSFYCFQKWYMKNLN